MSLTAVIWLAAFLVLSGLTLRRASWGIPLYMLTFYALPSSWWWGEGMLTSLTNRWNLFASLIFCAGVFLNQAAKPLPEDRAPRSAMKFLLLYGLNALVVCVLLADNQEYSFTGLTLLWKKIALLYVMWLAIKDEFDLKVLLYSIVAGSLYIGYEVVVNSRGSMAGARLEGIILPGVEDSNYIAGLLNLAIPLAGCLLLIGTKRERLFAFLSLPLILETILRCNSRGAFLALLIGGAWLLVRARGNVRRYAFAGVLLGALAAYSMVGNSTITDRFMTVFAPAGEREASAQSRLDYWKLAVRMIGDHPLGSGYQAAFKSERGRGYLLSIGEERFRAVHNGYLDIIASWGVQGFLLYVAAILASWREMRHATLVLGEQGRPEAAFLGTCIETALIVQLVSSAFLSSFDGEWFFWWMSMALGLPRVFQPVACEEVDADADAASELTDEVFACQPS